MQQQVVVGRRHEDLTGADRLAVLGVAHRERAGTRQDLGQVARGGRQDVDHDEGHGPRSLAQVGHEIAQRFDRARGAADDDHVPAARRFVVCHALLRTLPGVR